MKRNLAAANQEMKKSTLILTGILALFLTIQCYLYYDNIQTQKRNYIELAGSVAAKTASMDSRYEKEIISLITADITEQDREAGRRLLYEYGITEELAAGLFPNLEIAPVPLIVCVIFSCLLILLNYRQYSAVFEKVRSLTQAAGKILDDNYDCAIHEHGEGDFSKLAEAFSDVRRVIRNSMEQTRREKQQLAELLQNISHQFKTKLAAMMLYNDILLNRKVTEQQRIRFLQDNALQLENMNSMIQRILKLAKLDAHVVEYEKKPVSMRLLLEETVESFRETAREQGVRLELKPGEDFVLEQDCFWMKEAFQNIVKNCIEHTPGKGSVTIDISVTPIFRKVAVCDTGEGIAQADLANIFQRFYRSRASSRKDSVGIGLSIAKSVVEAHNGYIDVTSIKGQGTEFVITFLNGNK